MVPRHETVFADCKRYWGGTGLTKEGRLQGGRGTRDRTVPSTVWCGLVNGTEDSIVCPQSRFRCVVAQKSSTRHWLHGHGGMRVTDYARLCAWHGAGCSHWRTPAPLVIPHPLSFPRGGSGSVTCSTQNVSLQLTVLLWQNQHPRVLPKAFRWKVVSMCRSSR